MRSITSRTTRRSSKRTREPAATTFLMAGVAMSLLALPAMSMTAVVSPGPAYSGAAPVEPTLAEAGRPPQMAHESDAEIELALSAAPPSFAATADVYLMRDEVLAKVREGDGRTACVVTRTHPESSFPICFDAASTRSVLPTTIERARLYGLGLEGPEIHERILAGLASGELPVPERGAMAWMISPHQVIYAAGQRIGQWYPHVMIYMPGATLAELGLVEPQRGDTILVNPGTPLAHLLVKTRAWSTEDDWSDPDS